AFKWSLAPPGALPASRCVIDHRCGHASRQCVKQVFDGIGRQILAEQDGGLISLQRERLRMREILIAAGEGADGGAVSAAGLPLIANAKLKLRDRWSSFDGADGC